MALSAEGNDPAALGAENPELHLAADPDAGPDGDSGEPDAGRPGRPPATSAEEIARVALLLFDERGFDDTTVDDIARAVVFALTSTFLTGQTLHVDGGEPLT